MPRAARNTWRGAGLGLTLPELPPPRKHPRLGCTTLHHPPKQRVPKGHPKTSPAPRSGMSAAMCTGMPVPKGGLGGWSRDKRHMRGIRGILEAERGCRRETSPYKPQLRRGAPGELPAAWERRGAAGSPGTPCQILPRRRQDGTGSQGLPDPAALSHSLQAAASPTLCLFLNHGLHFKAILPM